MDPVSRLGAVDVGFLVPGRDGKNDVGLQGRFINPEVQVHQEIGSRPKRIAAIRGPGIRSGQGIGIPDDDNPVRCSRLANRRNAFGVSERPVADPVPAAGQEGPGVREVDLALTRIVPEPASGTADAAAQDQRSGRSGERLYVG